MARKFLSQKRQVGGLEPPRNSMDLSHESSKNSHIIRDNVAFPYTFTGDWSQNDYYPFDGSMKTLISEEISRRPNTRCNTPSIIARLMGMDTLLSDKNLVSEPVVKNNGTSEFNIPRKEGAENGTFGHVSISSKSTRKLSSKSLHHDYWQSDPDDSYRWLEEPKWREHPQEEELQKFKKEFEAWQAAQVRDFSHIADNEKSPGYLISDAAFEDDKVSFYANTYKTGREIHVDSEINHLKLQSHLGNGLQLEKNHMELSGTKFKGTHNPTSKNRRSIHGFNEVPPVNSDSSIDNSAPTRIVILRPGPDLAANDDESRPTSSSTIEDRSSIVDFLEEVKERLNSELHGRPQKRNTVVRGSGIETPFSEKISDLSNGNNAAYSYSYRENIPSNLETNLQRSESTRSYKSEIQYHGPSSPEFISRDTRRFLTGRLKNVLKKDTRPDPSASARGSLASSELRSESGRFDLYRSAYQERPNFGGNALAEMRNRNQSVRYGFDCDFLVNKEPPPRNLIRSLSAPVSGTSFAKLLLEDRHIVTGVQIRRKHEQVNNVSASVHRQRKERFNLREKVSTFRHNFALRKKLFGKKLQIMKETNTMGHDFLHDIMSGPSVMLNFDYRHENSTEVPPSPASVCSSINEEFWRPSSYASPFSTPDRHSVDSESVPHVFREISSNLSDLRRELKQLAASNGREDQSASEDLFTENITDIKDPMEAYIRDLLVASGLYDRSANKHFISSDPKPINIGAFQEVEGKLVSNQGFDKAHDEKKIDHRALLDLLNEKLPSILMPPSSTMSKLGREVSGYSTLPSPHGNRLLNMVWDIIHPYVQPPTDKSCYSLDNMVSNDLKAIAWERSVDKEANFLGRDVESWIIGDLVEEMVEDMMHRV